MQFLYIDPGTGSMLFSILIGIVSTVIFFGQRLFMKLKFFLSGGKATKISNNKIPYIIFSDHKRYWNVFKPICDEFENRNVELVYWTASHDDPALETNYKYVKTEFIGEGNMAYARLNMMNAGICLSTTPGLDVYQWRRSKNVDFYVHIIHMISDTIAYKMFGLDFYDAVLLSGPFQIEQIREIEKKHNVKQKELQIVGCTYMDWMASRPRTNTRTNKKTILVAPTWGQNGILCRYGEKLIDVLLNTDYFIVIRPHPQSYKVEKDLIDKLNKKYENNTNLSWNSDNDNFDILNSSYIMISDYSGVIFDYSYIFKRPVIYVDTNFDSSTYDAAWIEDKLWTFKVLPKLGIELKETDFPKIKSVIDNLIEDENLRKSREEIIRESWQHIGESAKLTVDYLLEKNNQINIGEGRK